MFDIGFTELLVVGIVALIVVGPKDLPMMFRTLGRFTARARAMGREFTSAMNAAADESGMRDAANELKGVTNPSSYGVNKLKEAADAFDNWDPSTTKPKGEVKGKPPEHHRKVDPERQADIEKIRAATEQAGQAKLDREAEEKAEAEAAPAKAEKAAKPKAPAKKPAAKKPAAKPASSKKTPAKKPAAKKVPAKKPAAKSDKAEEA